MIPLGNGTLGHLVAAILQSPSKLFKTSGKWAFQKNGPELAHPFLGRKTADPESVGNFQNERHEKVQQKRIKEGCYIC